MTRQSCNPRFKLLTRRSNGTRAGSPAGSRAFECLGRKRDFQTSSHRPHSTISRRQARPLVETSRRSLLTIRPTHRRPGVRPAHQPAGTFSRDPLQIYLWVMQLSIGGRGTLGSRTLSTAALLCSGMRAQDVIIRILTATVIATAGVVGIGMVREGKSAEPVCVCVCARARGCVGLCH